jgi:hypothetical protein
MPRAVAEAVLLVGVPGRERRLPGERAAVDRVDALFLVDFGKNNEFVVTGL